MLLTKCIHLLYKIVMQPIHITDSLSSECKAIYRVISDINTLKFKMKLYSLRIDSLCHA